MTRRERGPDEPDAPPADGARTARVETRHDAPGLVAGSIRPDNTESMTTTVDGDRVRTTIERGTTGGFGSSVDDYVVNLQVADRVVADARRRTRDDEARSENADRTRDSGRDGAEAEEAANSETNDTDADTDSDTTP
jgi:hypothetical protein